MWLCSLNGNRKATLKAGAGGDWGKKASPRGDRLLLPINLYKTIGTMYPSRYIVPIFIPTHTHHKAVLFVLLYFPLIHPFFQQVVQENTRHHQQRRKRDEETRHLSGGPVAERHRMLSGGDIHAQQGTVGAL